MQTKTPVPRLINITKAIERIREVTANVTFDEFQADWQKQWLVERGVEIASEASRGLPGGLNSKHHGIPWQKVAGIGNVLRHDYGRINMQSMRALVQESLPEFEIVCHEELAIALEADREA